MNIFLISGYITTNKLKEDTEKLVRNGLRINTQRT